MAVKKHLNISDIEEIVSKYNIGKLVHFKSIESGSVQLNYLLITEKRKYVLRYYCEERSKESVLFELNLIIYLLKHGYPTASPVKDVSGGYINFHEDKSLMIFEFIEGKHVENPTIIQRNLLIKKVAELNGITKNYRPVYRKFRWNYNQEFCRNLAKEKASEIGSENAKEKYWWMAGELEKLNLPSNLTRGVCHCDFHYSNIFFDDDRFVALIDFDDANYTYLTYDLVSLMNPFLPEFSWKTWEKFDREENILVFDECRDILREYLKYRPMSFLEKRHIFDVCKLNILIDCLWYFRRGKVEDFFEKRKIDALNTLGREKFFGNLFE
ncbi:MAG: homoserine kinase type [Kosmotogales bacterium]|nr:homoserine kinase type [Kosmotogales bacterium]